MAIPEPQLETWSHQGASVTASATYNSIQTALDALSSPVRGMNYQVYLQGSYKNTTNIRGDSDVDVVVELDSPFYPDLSALPAAQVQQFRATHHDATYLWADFRRDSLQALRAYYGALSVVEGDKSLKVRGGAGRLPADVVPALRLKKYNYFQSPQVEGYVEGIKFFARRDSREIINFPKPHYENGVAKQSTARTGGRYKPIVRIFKNARTYIVDNGGLADDVAPSYFLECFLYNAPDEAFQGTLQQAFAEVFRWLWSATPSTLMCQNAELPLFGGSPEQWEVQKSRVLLQAIANLWDTWG
jgi:hypothetical protein